MPCAVPDASPPCDVLLDPTATALPSHVCRQTEQRSIQAWLDRSLPPELDYREWRPHWPFPAGLQAQRHFRDMWLQTRPAPVYTRWDPQDPPPVVELFPSALNALFVGRFPEDASVTLIVERPPTTLFCLATVTLTLLPAGLVGTEQRAVGMGYKWRPNGFVVLSSGADASHHALRRWYRRTVLGGALVAARRPGRTKTASFVTCSRPSTLPSSASGPAPRR